MAVGLQPGHWDLLSSTVVGKCPNYPLTGVSLAAGPVWVTVKAQYPLLRAGTSNHRLLIDTSLPISGSVQHMVQPRLTSPCTGNIIALEPQGFGFEVTGSSIAPYFAVGPAG